MATAHPKAIITWKPNSIDVKLVKWEKINARAVEKAVRAILRERNRLRKEVLRAQRRGEEHTRDWFLDMQNIRRRAK